MDHQYIKDPMAIERKSFEMISAELGEKNGTGLKMDMIKRVIHTTADFELTGLLQFKEGVEDRLLQAFKGGATIISDTNMIKAGISKKMAHQLGVEINCFVDSEEAHQEAQEKGITRSMAAIDIAARLPGKKVFVIGNAPTALYRILELIEQNSLSPEAVIGVPVGFVGAAESKEALWTADIPSVITKGRKGGSTIGVALVNAVLKEAVKDIGK
ncbi:precorrin-8X methylmutase [Dehalobacterium formicoaceticum]|uniref:Precorrin-8X methylmutase n=1 Tax=Dehalobacterium formicoaceticum TaxID=51515 RepID=A0ABT1Y1N1_9FIRM|nr:precorrin-8X methylmutase [Dehalobacterium formicoaceticum]MCR6544774.1 precorrin-8X methylmutase [Dehalobacterium formicoaceticum]